MDTTLGLAISALTQGAAGEAGRQAWSALTGLARRRLGQTAPTAATLRDGSDVPPDSRQIAELSTALADHAGRDSGFARELEAWLAGAQRLIQAGDASAVNSVAGPDIGLVLQGRDFSAPVIQGGVHLHPRAPAPPLPPCQLPPSPVHFVDRTEPAAMVGQLATEAAAPGSFRLVVIWGPGGAGKSALAGRILHQAAGLYPGGLLFAALGAFGPGGCAAPDVVRAQWLRALGVHPSAVPADPGEAAALWRSLTTARPVGVLADDAADARQVRALLPGAGLVVVTSRYQMSSLVARDGARLIRLGPLDSPAAADLAGRIIARPQTAPDELTELARYCGLWPLAICTAAARLAARPHLAIAQVTGELAATRNRLHLIDDQEGCVTSAMNTSYDALDPPAARAWRLLALHPGPDFTATSAAALLDTDLGDADELIDQLVSVSLLEESAPGRWAQHDVMREHARHLAEGTDRDDERTAVMARVIDFYLNAAAAADLVILPGRLRIAAAFGLPVRCPPAFPGPAEALAWFDTELPNLLAAQQLAIRLTLDPVAWQFCDVTWGWCSHHQNHAAWRTICEQSLSAARACGDAHAEAWAGSRLAACHVAARDLTAAVAVADHAIRTAWLNGDRAGEGSAREQRGNAALAAENFDEAIEHYLRGLDCWRRVTPHQRAVALLERQLGRAYAGRGDYREANTHLMTSLTIFDRLGERYHAARTRHAIAVTRLADPGGTSISSVLDLLEQAQPLMEAEDHPLHLSELLTAQAEAHIRAGNTGQARACADKAEIIQHDHHVPDSHHARTYLNRVTAQLASSAL
jgi:tetratricopeptide (TPR) repeat protein